MLKIALIVRKFNSCFDARKRECLFNNFESISKQAEDGIDDKRTYNGQCFETKYLIPLKKI